MKYNSATLPDAVKRLLPKDVKAELGIAGLTMEELYEYQNRPAALPTSNPQPIKRSTLDSGIRREEKGCVRARIRFVVYATRPADWDGYCIKQIQDCLVAANLLDEDGWDQLEGSVVSEKVHSKSEERTEIEIDKPNARWQAEKEARCAEMNTDTDRLEWLIRASTLDYEGGTIELVVSSRAVPICAGTHLPEYQNAVREAIDRLMEVDSQK